jgi:cathepsin B
MVRIALVCALLAVAAAVPVQNVPETEKKTPWVGDVTPSFVAEVNSKAKGWEAGYNPKFRGMTVADIKTLMGALKEPAHMKAPPATHYTPGFKAPASFDARTAWPNCPSIAYIRDQSTCGSCWAFGAVEAMSDRLCIGTNATTAVQLSAEDMVSCCLIECGMGCNGGFPTGAWHFWKSHGLVTEDKYPYVFPPCEHHTNGTHYKPCGASKPTPKCQRKEELKPRYHGKSAYSVPSARIMEEIATYGPVEGAFTVFKDFLTYRRHGHLQDPPRQGRVRHREQHRRRPPRHHRPRRLGCLRTAFCPAKGSSRRGSGARAHLFCALSVPLGGVFLCKREPRRVRGVPRPIFS